MRLVFELFPILASMILLLSCDAGMPESVREPAELAYIKCTALPNSHTVFAID